MTCYSDKDVRQDRASGRYDTCRKDDDLVPYLSKKLR